MLIRLDDLTGHEIFDLLQQHRQEMFIHSPAESVHALDLEAMRKPDMTFWSAWDGKQIMGCGALKELSSTHAEVKSMRTSKAYLRQGVAKSILLTIIEEARLRRYETLCLETGTAEAFTPAHTLYRREGFIECGPFGNYLPDPYSLFMSLKLRSD